MWHVEMMHDACLRFCNDSDLQEINHMHVQLYKSAEIMPTLSLPLYSQWHENTWRFLHPAAIPAL